MRKLLTFLTLFLMISGVASAEYCTEKDDLYKKGTDHLNSLYEFGLKIQKAVKDKDLEAIKAMIKFPMNDKKITKSYLDNKTFDQVFSQVEIDFILQNKPECNSVGMYKGYMLGNGTVWYNDSATIIALNLKTEGEVPSTKPRQRWKVGNDYLTPKCFAHEWISSDNLKAVNKHYSKKLPKEEEFNFSKIGTYYERYIPLEDSFDPKWGDGKMQSLTRYFKDCAGTEPVNAIMQLDNSLEMYEVVSNPEWDDPKIACRILAPFINAKCLDVKTVLFTVGFSGSMPPYSQINIYGVYELKNKSRIVLPLSFDVTLPKS